MKYSDLVENGTTDREKQEFLVGGDMAAITQSGSPRTYATRAKRLLLSKA